MHRGDQHTLQTSSSVVAHLQDHFMDVVRIALPGEMRGASRQSGSCIASRPSMDLARPSFDSGRPSFDSGRASGCFCKRPSGSFTSRASGTFMRL